MSIRPALLLATALVSAAVIGAADGNWPQFRGVDGAGVAAPDARPPLKIGPAENVKWKTEVPWSPSSPCVWGERIFLTTWAEPNLEVRCHDRATGALRWTRALRPDQLEDFNHFDGSPAASTPATDGVRVVSYFGSWGLVCHDFEGRELWRRPLPCAVSGGRFGTGTSPVIHEGVVLLNRDQYQFSTLLAVDVKTGRTVWEAPRPDSSGSFGTPALWRQRGGTEVVLAGSAQLKGYDFATGAERWSIANVTGTVCTTPVVGDGLLFFAAWSPGQSDSPRQTWEAFLKAHDKNGDGVVDLEEIDVARRDYLRAFDRNRDGKITPEDWARIKAGDARAENVLIAVRPGGRGDIGETHVAWKYRKALPYVPSPLHYQGRLYLVRDQGQMTSLEPQTGEPFYAQEKLGPPGNYYASPVAADGRIYVASLPGKLVVVKAGGAKPEVLHTADFGERILATPALVGKNVYLRTQTKLYAFEE